MKLITRDTDYALRALSYVARKKKDIFTVTGLVKELNIPRAFLRKILQKLNKAGILRSHRGAGGGFLLAKKASKIYLVDLIEIFQGPLNINECFFKKIPCPNRGVCILRKRIKNIEKRVLKELKAITVSSLLK